VWLFSKDHRLYRRLLPGGGWEARKLEPAAARGSDCETELERYRVCV